MYGPLVRACAFCFTRFLLPAMRREQKSRKAECAGADQRPVHTSCGQAVEARRRQCSQLNSMAKDDRSLSDQGPFSQGSGVKWTCSGVKCTAKARTAQSSN